jgi:hypothetical protein
VTGGIKLSLKAASGIGFILICGRMYADVIEMNEILIKRCYSLNYWAAIPSPILSLYPCLSQLAREKKQSLATRGLPEQLRPIYTSKDNI